MAISLKHTTQATGTDAGNGEIGKTQWNENHTLTMTSGKLLGRSTAGDGAAEEITVGSGLTLSGGTLTASGGGGAPAGSTGEIQFNDGGAFGAFTNVTITDDGYDNVLRNGAQVQFPGDVASSAGLFQNRDGTINNRADVFIEGGSSDSYAYGALVYENAVYGPYLLLLATDITNDYSAQVQFRLAPGSSYSYTLTLPTSAGSSGQALTTDGSGVLSWTDPAKSSAPATTTSTGRAGEIRYDSGYVYVCVATNSWKRAALSTW